MFTFFDYVYHVALGIVMLWGLGSVIFTLPKVRSWWKPLYWVALLLALLPIVMIVSVLLQQQGLTGISGENILRMLRLLMFVLGLELIAVPWVHRLEAKYFGLEKTIQVGEKNGN